MQKSEVDRAELALWRHGVWANARRLGAFFTWRYVYRQIGLGLFLLSWAAVVWLVGHSYFGIAPRTETLVASGCKLVIAAFLAWETPYMYWVQRHATGKHFVGHSDWGDPKR